MFYKLNSQDRSKFQKLLDVLDLNIATSEAYNLALEDKALLDEGFDLPFKRLDPSPFLQNPYMKHVSPKETKIGTYHLHYRKYSPFEGFVYDEISLNEVDYKEKIHFGCFEKEYSFLCLDEEINGNWMSITPHEINTMEKAINEAKGEVTAYGLGLGYFPYMVSLKKEVTKITIVERDKEIVSIFKKYLLPCFENKDKIDIVIDDAFDYAKRDSSGFIFFDIYRQPIDALPLYLKMKNILCERDNQTVFYWIEESILSLIRRAILILIEEEIEYGNSDSGFKKAKTFDDKLINGLHYFLKDRHLNSYDDIHKLLSNDSIKEIANHLYPFL